MLNGCVLQRELLMYLSIYQRELLMYADNNVKTNSGILNAVVCKLACPGEDK